MTETLRHLAGMRFKTILIALGSSVVSLLSLLTATCKPLPPGAHGAPDCGPPPLHRKWFFISNTDLASLLEIGQKMATIGAIFIGGWWTWHLFGEHREFYAKADIHQEVSAIRLGDNLILLRVTVLVKNTGNILLTLTEGRIQVERVLPLTPVTLEAISNTMTSLFDETDRFAWPVIRIKRLKWDTGTFNIEPGEQDESIFEFIISNPPDLININTYLSNPHNNQLWWNHSDLLDLREARK